MKQLKRLTALLLCIMMMFPTQGMTAIAETAEQTESLPLENGGNLSADENERIDELMELDPLMETERIDEIMELEPIKKGKDNDRIQVTLPLQPLEDYEDYAIYWNPGDKLLEELATASDATASNAAGGLDSANGRTPSTPVKTLEAAVRRAEAWMEEDGILPSDMIIYAMNPMEIADGELYVLNGGNIRIAAWEGRSYDSDAVFYINGGQLTLMNTVISGRESNDDPDLAELIYVRGGILQMGQNVTADGRIVMDYHKDMEAVEWEEQETATASDAANRKRTSTASDAAMRRKTGTAFFDINDYILNTDEESLELLTDEITEESTWKDPIIELLEGFGGEIGGFLLDVRMDDDIKTRELVKTLYADDVPADEFLDYFVLADADEEFWSLEVETQTAGQIRDASLPEDIAVVPFAFDTFDTEVLTQKTLIASRSGGSGDTIYWNPGGDIDWLPGTTYPAGKDVDVDGTTPWDSFKTWEKAVGAANGGTIICMQPLTLGAGAAEYLGTPYVDGNTFTLKSNSLENIVTLTTWESYPMASIIVPDGTRLVLDTIILEGLEDSGGIVGDTVTVHVTGGDVVIENNVTAETGYIQIDATDNLADRPVVVNSIGLPDDGNITLFFGGINNNLNYRYVDVVVPSAELDDQYEAENKAALGDALLGRFGLQEANMITGANARFSWILQKDTIADGNLAEPQKLELYTQYYYDAIYLDGERGNDDYLGATCESPVATWDQAKKLWMQEMTNSIAARIQAHANNLSAADIEALYPVPKKIYICGTVTVDDVQEWNLAEVHTDYDGSTIKTEIQSHIENKDDATLIHAVPEVLVHVKDGGDLTFGKGIYVRNYTDLVESSTVLVEGGSKFKMTADAVLTGEKLKADNITVDKATTLGIHVDAKDGAAITLDAEWTGSIEKRGHGMWLDGAGTTASMAGGSIQNHNSFDQAAYNAVAAQKVGAGVVVAGGASFSMQGGKISDNVVYQYGAGVYVSEGSEFIMTGGEITGNKMSIQKRTSANPTNTSDSYVVGYGIGIYAEQDTTVDITGALIARQQAHIGEGVGIWSDGLLKLDQSFVNENYTSSTTSTFNDLINKGVAIHVGVNGTLQMTASEVKGNYAYNGDYGNVRGVGVFLLSDNENYITGSTITDNIAGRAYQSSVEEGYRHSAGGGIYMEGSKLTLTDTVVDGNRAIYGGGIYVKQDSADTEMLTIIRGSISNNTGQGMRHTGTGGGGGIFATYAYIRITDTLIENNYTRGSGGGIYAYRYCKVEITGSPSSLMQITGNRAYSNGGGIQSYYYSTLSLDYVEMTGNKAESSGHGGAVISYDYAELTIDNSQFSNNSATHDGGGVATYNTSDKATITNSTFDGNRAGQHGGGMYLRGINVITDVVVENNAATQVGGGIMLHELNTIERVLVQKNTAGRNGGGIYYGGNNPVGGTGRLWLANSRILDNEATALYTSNTDRGRGGGFANWSGGHSVAMENVTISGNKAVSGGGIANNGILRTRNVDIVENEAEEGGGIYMWTQNLIFYESRLDRNTATANGGGVYISSGNFHFAEDRDNSVVTSLTGNEAGINGGGIYHNAGHVTFDVINEFQNRAGEQGSNIYTKQAGGSYVNGTFKQPVPASDPGVYNVYVDVTASNTDGGIIIDPSAVKIEAKTGTSKDAIYLTAGNSFLSYIKEPDVADPDMPVSLNPDAFEVGSIVIKPSRLNYINTYKPNADLWGHTEFRINYTPTLLDAAINLPYNSGGILPRRTTLSRYVDSSNSLRFNVVLVGEGVYLDGEGGDDDDDGLTPATAVKTFAVAKERLEEHINDPANKDDEGFVPFIYICGTVTISGTEPAWELDYDDALFMTDNINYIVSETNLGKTAYPAQVRRFASFVRYPNNNNLRPMIRVGSGSDQVQLEMGRIIIDGMSEAVITATQDYYSPIVEIMNGSQLDLTTWSQLKNNYYYGVVIRGTGKLVMDGDAPIPGEPHEEEKNRQLLNMQGQFVRLYDNSSVEMNGYSRILTDGLAKRLWGNTSIYAIYAPNLNTNLTVHMNDYSSITNLPLEEGEAADSLRINFGIDMAGTHVGKKEVHLTGHAKIENFLYNAGSGKWPIRIQGGADSNILMKDDAKIVNLAVQYAIYASASYTAAEEAAGKTPLTISMLDRAYIENTYDRGIESGGTRTIFNMESDAKIKAKNYGFVSNASNIIVTMSGKSSIMCQNTGLHLNYNVNVDMSGDSKIEAYDGTYPYEGIWANANTNVSVTLRDNASVTAQRRGIRTNATGSSDIMLRDNAAVTVTANGGDYAGIYFNDGANSVITGVMRDDAVISSVYRGIYFNGGTGTFVMNEKDDPTDDGNAMIKVSAGNGHGVTIAHITRNLKFIMNKNALIKGNTGGSDGGGVSFTSNNNNSETVGNFLEMNDNSRITNHAFGIYLHKGGYPVDIKLADSAAVDQNFYAVYERYSTERMFQVNVELKDNARFSGNRYYGIFFNGADNFERDVTGYQRITLSDSAVIGGTSAYNAADPESGNGYSGIYAKSPIELTLNGDSNISWNGHLGSNDASWQGVFVSREFGNINYYRSGDATITLNDDAFIANNRGSIYAQSGQTLMVSGVPRMLENPVVVTLNGTGGEPAIRDNGTAVYLGNESVMKLLGTSKLASPDSSKVLDCYGQLVLDGRSVIDGQVHLRTSDHPVTMTHPVNDTSRRYHLYLAEGFLGKVVVQPDMAGVTDVTDQLDYFVKDGADGLAAAKRLIDEAPNIILEGENHVYLSGAGNDENNGNSPATAVRTFRRAKELLETGYFRDGANIIITTQTVVVKPDDLDWSFAADGTVTNTHPKGGQTWKPLVIREKSYQGRMITVDSTTGGRVEFKNITIDGGSEEGTIMTTSSLNEVLAITRSGDVLLGEGAVLQNNYAQSTVTSNTSVGVIVEEGSLEIDGGIIQNMVRESINNATNFILSSAVFVKSGNGIYPASFVFKSGQIRNNEVRAPLSSAYDETRLSAVVVRDNYAFLEMSGGIISDNVTVTHATSGSGNRGGAILFYRSHGDISGGTIRNNTGGIGSAIYYEGILNQGWLTISGGQIIDNKTNAPGKTNATEVNSAVNIRGYHFELKGGSADIRDNIYLHSNQNLITLSGPIYQKERVYHVYLNTGSFGKGYTVVQPDKNWLSNASSYLNHFELHTKSFILDRGQLASAPVTSTVAGVKENECLILMKAVFLDYDNGSDTNGLHDGTSPSRAVKSFTRAVNFGRTGNGSRDYYVIYLSGRAVNLNSEPTWNLPATAYMARYTGFTVYQDNGVSEKGAPYHEYLIEPAYNLTLDGIRVYGRRSMDSTLNNGNSIVHVNAGIEVVMKQSSADNITYLGRNYNLGEYDPPEGSIISLGSKGGAFRVEDQGRLRIEGGTISDVTATYGSAVYLEASTTDRARMHITGTPTIAGSVYLSGNGVTSAAFLETDQSYKPDSTLLLAVGNDYNGRTLVEYVDEIAIGDTQYKYFDYEDSLKALYDIVIQGDKNNFIRLSQKQAYYVDGQTSNGVQNGLTPETAFHDLRSVYQAIADAPVKAEGYLVYVVNTVDVDAGDNIVMSNIEVKTGVQSVYHGTYSDAAGPDIGITGQVYFKRYSKPSGYTETGDEAVHYIGFNRDTLLKTLFHIKENGQLTLNGIYVDGHSVESIGDQKTVVAPAVEAHSPLFVVEPKGILSCGYLDEKAITGGIRTNTKLLNNKNINKKENVIGELNSSPITEGSGGGIELLGEAEPWSGSIPLGGTAILKGTEFSNLKLGDRIAGGEDVYSNGYLHFANQTLFNGTVYLEGFGTAEGNQETSRYLTVDLYGTPVKIDFQVLMRDPYNRRTVVYHAPEGNGPGDETQIGRYRLEERVKEFFMLNKREGHPYIYELQLPPAVYIGGPNATDNQNDTVAGSTPSNPVASLRRAFQLLKTRGGGSIFVVGTIEVETNVYITGNTYEGDDEPSGIFLGSTNQVKIIRYIQPDFAKDDHSAAVAAGYDVEDFTGVMMNVQSGNKAVFSNNVIFDGHSEMKVSDPSAHIAYPKEIEVSRTTKSMAPMITVEQGGTLELLDKVTLQDNDNEFNLATETPGEAMNGGVLYNSGTASVDGALFTNNHAVKASGIYQDGTFTIKSSPENLKDHSFYLTARGAEDHVIRTEAAMPDDLIFDVDMDHAVKGRDVVKFLDPSAYDPDVDAEHGHFRLGSSVPADLFLVEAENDPTVLELQNWEVLKVEVPTDIYLVITRRGTMDSTTRLKAVIDDPAVGTDLFTAPEYTIKNKGNYDARVSVTGFANKTTEAGITAPLMNLTTAATDVAAANDLYLAIKGLDDTTSGTGFDFSETSLQPYAEDPVTAGALVLGTLTTRTDGNFTFIGAVGTGFVDNYLDNSFPVEGVDKEEVQQYMDGTGSSGMNAKAKYLMKYKVEIVPSRR